MRFTVFATFFLVFSLFFAANDASGAAQEFAVWLKDLKSEAAHKGISRPVIDGALPDTLTPITRVLELDRKQPEGTTQLDDYLRNAVTPDRVQKGRAKVAAFSTLLKKVEAAYNVDRHVIVALWGIETSYGRNTGGYDVVHALATLAYDGRRGDFFRGELFKALQILDEGHIRHASMKGSWAGAMGQSQFMPSSFMKFAVDFDKDGKRDIWNSEADVFASAANYLASHGWKKGGPWGRQVKLPKGLDRSLIGYDKVYSLQFWHDKGVRLANGKSVPFEGETQASIVQPNGEGATAYLVYENYRTVLKWNKSSYFATAVFTLADRLR